MANIQYDYMMKIRSGTGEVPTLRYFSTDNVYTVAEYNGLSQTVIADMDEADDPVALPLSYIASGTFLFIESDQEVSIYLNDTTNDPWTGTSFYLSATTGFTAVYVKNISGESATIKYLFGGD